MCVLNASVLKINAFKKILFEIRETASRTHGFNVNIAMPALTENFFFVNSKPPLWISNALKE
jgi:hypothetical protein